MEIVVCIKRVAEIVEGEVEIDASGLGVDERDLVWAINEWDDFAIEAAVRLAEELGGRVTALTVGDEDDEEVLRRALAMGADEALRLWDPAFAGSDAAGLATVLHRAIADRPHDLVLTGAISGDEGRGHVGGMLAARLGIPWVSLATELRVEDGTARVRHEVEGGLERIVELDLPALITVQTGINEPRYVSIRGIRRVSGMEIPVLDAADLELDPATVGAAGARIETLEAFLPPRGEGAEILEGDDEEVAAELARRLLERGAA